jgi:serralysin
VQSALAQWAAVAEVHFTQVPDNRTTVGDLRFAKTIIGSSSEEAHAYYPSNSPWGGDVWLRHGAWDSHGAEVPGTYDYLAVVHEIGHALGLKHGFQGPETLPHVYDNYSFSVMSYSAYSGGDNYASFYPTTPMYFDLMAIQALYGRAPHRPGNTTYSFSSAGHYWQTIDDTGGIDSIVYAGGRAGRIDLQIGHWSNLGLPIYFDNGRAQLQTVMIGPETHIENATGGSGNDRIFGNELNNRINGNPGSNVLTGGGGADQFVFNTALSSTFDRVTDFAPDLDKVDLSHRIFTALSTAGHALAPAMFHEGSHFTTGIQRIDYNPANGWLVYDTNGVRPGGSPTHFMTLQPHLDLHNTDFLVLA